MKRIVLAFMMAWGLVAVAASPATAAPISGTYVTGGATTGTGPYVLTSTDSTYSILGLVFNTPIPFSQLTDLSASYIANLGGIGGGAPRFVLDLGSNGDIEINWGPPASFADPTLGPGNTGNLIPLTDTGRYDNSGVGGAFYSTRAEALALAGNFDVFGVYIVVDSFGGNDRNFGIEGINAEGTVAPVPEPLSLAAFGVMGLTVLGFRVRRKSVA